jgi:hypothetical protein
MPTVTVGPATVTLYAGGTQTFTANQAVNWSISPAGAGTISTGGLYTAPATVATQQTVTITATSQASGTQTGTATVTLMPTVTVGPATVTLYAGGTQTFTANQAVNWSISPAGVGTISTGGLYTAPATVATQQTVTITATSQASGSQTGTATVTLMPTVTVGPATVTLYAGGTQTFTANQAVNWSISPAGVGTISTGGLYTAPATIATQQAVTITATSQASGSQTGTATVTLMPSVSVTPATATLYGGQTQQFTSNQPVTWSSSPTGAGGIDPATGLYTAPAAIATPQQVTVTATSQADQTQSASAAVTLSPTISIPALRINAGGPTFVDPAGRVWLADTDFTTSCSGNGNASSFVPPAGLDGEYGTYRWCDGSTPQITYQIPVSNMEYLVTLKFAEPNVTWGPGARIFSVAVNGQTNSALSQVDVSANAGATQKAWDTTIPVSASDGQITIAFSGILRQPIINAIEIVPANSIEVVPETATLSERQSLQFTAFQPGVNNPAVNWSITPANLGSIDSTGLYTAPGLIPAATSVTITAASTTNSNILGTAVVSLSPTDPSSFTALRINAGGPTFVDPAGRVWMADTDFTTSCSGNGNTFSFVPPAGLDGEYGTLRWCDGSSPQITYQIPVPNMEYLVTLKFAEPNVSWGPGARIFSVAVNGQTNSALSQVDVSANAGATQKAWDATIPVSVSNGQITIAISAIQNWPIIDAIEIAPANSIEVVPQTASLGLQQQLQFTALIPGQTNPAVTWSLNPAGLGTISASGLYAAPAALAAPTTVTVIATSVANPNAVGTAVVNLSPTNPISFSALRINAGGPTYQDPAGRVWMADTDFTTSCSGNGNASSFVPPAGLDGEYGTYRWCDGSSPQITYQIPVPNMDYLVTLKFAEPNVTWGPGARIFSVAVNGQTNSALSQVDVSANAGATQTAWDATIPISVSNGQLAIAFSGILRQPIINAIEIVPVGSVGVLPVAADLWASQQQQFLANVADPANPGVSWSLTPAGVGAITATGLYTAPASIAAPQTVTVTATNASNPVFSGAATVNLYPPGNIAVSPASVTLSTGQTQQFTVVMSGGPGSGVVWSLSPAGMGTISSSGLYTAPASIYTPQTVTLTAAGNGSTATAAILLVPTVTLTVSPATTTLGPSQAQQFTATVLGRGIPASPGPSAPRA